MKTFRQKLKMLALLVFTPMGLSAGCGSEAADPTAGAAGSGGDAGLVDSSTVDSSTDAGAADTGGDSDSGVAQHYGLELFVAQDGNDKNPGTKAQPFATLERARDQIRDLKTKEGLPVDGVVVWIRSGLWLRDASFELSTQDSGESQKPVVYSAYPGDQVRVAGAVKLSNAAFGVVTEASAVWQRLDLAARGKVVQLKLSENGVSDLGKLEIRGFGKSATAGLELFFNGAAMPLARWPDANVTDKVASPLDDTIQVSGNATPAVAGSFTKSGTSNGVNAFKRSGLVNGKQYNLYRHNWDYQGSNYTAWFLTSSASGYPSNTDPWWSRYDENLGSMKGSNGATGLPTTQDPLAVNHGFVSIGEAVSDTAFSYLGTRAERWTKAEEPWLHGYFKYMWADLHVPVASIDIAKHTILLTQKPGYGIESNQPYYAENLLEEITVPGEWYLDRGSSTLYFWPPSELASAEVLVSTATKPLVSLKDTSFTTFRNLSFEVSRNELVRIQGGSNNTLDRCALRNAGTNAASISGQGNGIDHSEISDCGDRGLSLSGGDRAKLTAAGNFARNSTFRGFGRWSWTYSPGVNLSGAGNIVSHNVFSGAPHSAILYSGNEHRIEFNDIHDVCQYSSDAGAIYSGRDWGYRGNLIQYNFIHNIQSWFEGYGVHGVYLDDCLSGIKVFGNVFYKISGYAVLHGGGRDNLIENNVMARNGRALSADSRGLTSINNLPGDSWNILERLTNDSIQYQQDPWSSAYPKLALVPKDWSILSDPKLLWLYPQGTVFRRNIGFDNKSFTSESNNGGTGTFNKYEELSNNIENQDPLFVNESALDLTLRADSPAFSIAGFQPIAFGQIGPIL